MKKGQIYPGDFKKKVVKDVRNNHLSYIEATVLQAHIRFRNGKEFTLKKVLKPCIRTVEEQRAQVASH